MRARVSSLRCCMVLQWAIKIAPTSAKSTFVDCDLADEGRLRNCGRDFQSLFENKPTGWYVFTRERLHCQGYDDDNRLRKK